ncbi:hypothetical protein UCRNP2_1551 [Neofusicoccum parvum UCRNP2]|uniref:Uncharacterized protein n=1 Tax=Botryosphaeria parva (strain UCR-NP2) TaxID=1287680 RepID=R1EVL7_BOTPV|nr:hypothetical protein UCRNP2_1551 [Neofusicoccum parvum UCRNP2]
MSGIDIFDRGAWDDRALVRGWNQQVKEYSKYHGLHRRDRKARLDQQLTQEEIFGLSELADPEELEEMGIRLTDAQPGAKPNESQDATMENDDTAYQAHADEQQDISLTDAVSGAANSVDTDAAERQLMQEAHEQQQQFNQHRTQDPAAVPQVPPIPGPAFAAAPGGDDALKNMMMSWYYAGYYQGIYETKQHAGQPSA